MNTTNPARYIVTCPNRLDPETKPLLMFPCATRADTRKVWPRAKGKAVYRLTK